MKSTITNKQASDKQYSEQLNKRFYELLTQCEQQTDNAKQAKQFNKTFIDLLREYEKASVDLKSEQFTDSLQTLSTVCTYSVLKKVYSCSYSSMIKELKNNLYFDIQTVSNKKQETTITDSYDLIQVAIIELLNVTNKQTDRTIHHWLEQQTEQTTLNRKVVIKDSDSKGLFKTVKMSPIQQVFRSIRRYIENSRQVQTANGKYTYIEQYVQTDSTTGETTYKFYKRLNKYSQLASDYCDINGKQIAITANKTDVEKVDNIINDLKLSKQQAKILQYRLSGYGYKAIATALGVDHRNVLNQAKRIQEKAVKIGFKPLNI